MKELVNYLGHLDKLRLNREAAQARRAAIPKPPSLEERIQQWQNSLSCEDKTRAWTMKEFRALFNDSPQKIGAALFELGWTRKRIWRDDRPTARYWFK